MQILINFRWSRNAVFSEVTDVTSLALGSFRATAVGVSV